MRETSFGQVWVARIALGVVLLAVIMGRSSEHWTTAFLAGMLLASLALVGHTQTSEVALWVGHVGADGAHLLAVFYRCRGFRAGLPQLARTWWPEKNGVLPVLPAAAF